MQLRTSHSRASFTLLAPPVWCRSPSRSGWRFTPMVERHGLSGAVPAFLTTSSRAQMRAVRTFRVGSCIHRRNVRSMLPTLTPRLRRRVELIRSKHVCTGTPLPTLLRRIRRRSPAEIAIPHRRRNVWSRDEKKAPREIGGLFFVAYINACWRPAAVGLLSPAPDDDGSTRSRFSIHVLRRRPSPRGIDFDCSYFVDIGKLVELGVLRLHAIDPNAWLTTAQGYGVANPS